MHAKAKNVSESRCCSRRQGGFVSAEILIVIVVLGLLAWAALGPLTSFFQRGTGSAETTNARNLVNNVSTLRLSDGRYPENLHQAMQLVEAYPANMESTSSGVRNSWGGNVTVARGSNARHFVLTYENVPAAACQQLATSVISARNIDVYIGSQSAPSSDPEALSNLAIAQCSGDANTIRWQGFH
ncbi:type 4 pilus major pilin [Billgrantia desiderata]|uniref:type 4 pilus major pilin n=1 Tax=Billgrantia desiderata TaxID=52021 RepID=UPI003BEF3F8E